MMAPIVTRSSAVLCTEAHELYSFGCDDCRFCNFVAGTNWWKLELGLPLLLASRFVLNDRGAVRTLILV
jgi:hypothetical protein